MRNSNTLAQCLQLSTFWRCSTGIAQHLGVAWSAYSQNRRPGAAGAQTVAWFLMCRFFAAPNALNGGVQLIVSDPYEYVITWFFAPGSYSNVTEVLRLCISCLVQSLQRVWRDAIYACCQAYHRADALVCECHAQQLLQLGCTHLCTDLLEY